MDSPQVTKATLLPTNGASVDKIARYANVLARQTFGGNRADCDPILERYTVFLEADVVRSSTLRMHLYVNKNFPE
jgi:hypothetical protein